MELESGLFRILDEALNAYLTQNPDRVAVAVDWSERFEARITATRGTAAASGAAASSSAAAETARKKGEELPPALAAMIEDRRADEREAAEAARLESIVALPASTWREIETRASTLGITAELVEEGSELRIAVELPPVEEAVPA